MKKVQIHPKLPAIRDLSPEQAENKYLPQSDMIIPGGQVRTLDGNEGRMLNFQEFIYNQNSLNKMMQAYFMQYFETPRINKIASQEEQPKPKIRKNISEDEQPKSKIRKYLSEQEQTKTAIREPSPLENFLDQNKNQISQLSSKQKKLFNQQKVDQKQAKDVQFEQKPEFFSLKINHNKYRYQMLYGAQFKNILDPRDVVLEHIFHIETNASFQETAKQGFDFLKSQIQKRQGSSWLKQLRTYFQLPNYLNENKLEEKEVKNYAASNILLNLHSVFLRTMESIQNCKELEQKLELEKLKIDFILQTEHIIKNILINLADYYPQAPITGGTPRIKNVIHEISRVEQFSQLPKGTNIPSAFYQAQKQKIQAQQQLGY